MKKFVLSLMLALAPALVQAQTKIYGVWGFTPGSTQGNYVRAILEESNKIQRQYEFIFDHRPGAGSYIAARSVLERDNALLANSAAQFVRPHLYPDTAWRQSDFQPVMLMGQNPAVLITRGASLAELLGRDRVSLATAGTGSSTHLMAEVFAREIRARNPRADVVMVHHRDTNEAFVSVMGGHTDATFEFLGDARGRATAATRFVGLTGDRALEGTPTLGSLGLNELAGVTGVFLWVAPASMPREQVLQIRKIFLEAERSETVQRLYRTDFASRDPRVHDGDNLEKFYRDTALRFQRYSQGITVK